MLIRATGGRDAAGSVIAVLAWLYYTALIVLFGAELTQVWATRYGQGTQPADGARTIGSQRNRGKQVA